MFGKETEKPEGEKALLDRDETIIDEQARDRIIKARVKMQTQNPFFSYLVMGLEPTQNYEGETCYVDNTGKLGYNPEFIHKLNDDELKTVLTHEVMHVALLHLTRKSERKNMVWNIACDIVVNNTLLNNKFSFTGFLKKGVLPKNNSFKLKGKKGDLEIKDIDKKYVEEVYDELRRFIDEETKSFFDGNGNLRRSKEGEYREAMDNIKRQLKSFDEHRHAKKSKENRKEIEENERKWKRILSEAHMQSKQQGREPAGVDRYVEGALESRISWREILYKYVTREIPFDYTYNRPSKRSVATGFYMPSMLKEHVDITVAIDTSGSIEGEDLRDFLSEVIGIGNAFESLRIHLLFWDTHLNNYYTVDKYNIDEIMDYKINGGRGTVFTNIYNKVEELVPETKLLVFFTDGYADYPSEEKYNTLWILSKNSCPEKQIPFGDTIKMVGDKE